MPLHPEIAALVAARDALGRPPLKALTPAEARAFNVEDLPNLPPGKAVAEVRPLVGGPVPMRLYRPYGAGAMPIVVYVHGGGFVICSLDTHDSICRNIAADAGAIVVSVDYRMAPEHRFPVASDDVLAAVRFLAERAADFGGDPARIVVAGDSAGGNLAAVTALRIRDEGGPALAGQLLVYPVTAHHTEGFASYAEFAEGYGLTADDMAWFFDHYLPDPADRRHPHAAPLHAPDLSGLPPALVLVAECDVLRDEAIAYADRLEAAGVAVTRAFFPGLHHGCLGLVGVTAAVDPVQAAIAGWLADRLGS